MNLLIYAVISGTISSWENVRSYNPLLNTIGILDYKLLTPSILLLELTPQPFISP